MEHISHPGIQLTFHAVDPAKVIRLTLAYPASTGRNFPELLRVVDSLQLGDKYKVCLPP